MNTLLQTIIEGNPAITISVNASDLRYIILEIVREERQRIKDAVSRSRETFSIGRAEAARRLGINVSTLDRWAVSGYITPVKVGTKVLYRASDIDAMLTRDNEAN